MPFDVRMADGRLHIRLHGALSDRRRATTLTRPVKSAIVVASDVQYGMARMFQTLNDHPQITLEIFRDRLEALAWLGR